MLQLKRGDCPQIQTEMLEFIALPFPFTNERKIWQFHVVVFQGWQRNVQKSLMHVQSCCFANETYCFFDVLVSVPVVVAKAP